MFLLTLTFDLEDWRPIGLPMSQKIAQMLTDFQNYFIVGFISKHVMESQGSYHTSNESLHYIVNGKCKETTKYLKQMSRLTK